MKFYALFIALIASFGLSAEINWSTNYSASRQHAMTEDKPMLLYFTGSDWCPWCKKMDSEIMTAPEFEEALGNSFIFVKVDFPRKKQQDEELKNQNKILKNQFEISGYPKVVLLDSNGNMIDKLGYRKGGAEHFAKKIEGILSGQGQE
jgi:protein disulfide-isomerase